MPKFRAIAQACCPPAPPKQANTCRLVSYPFPWMPKICTQVKEYTWTAAQHILKQFTCVRALIGRHMASLATSMKPNATSKFDMDFLVTVSTSEKKQLTCRFISLHLRDCPFTSTNLISQSLKRLHWWFLVKWFILLGSKYLWKVPEVCTVISTNVTNTTYTTSYSDRRRPKQRLASVTVNGPPTK